MASNSKALPGGASSSTTKFTPEMQDRQARNKDPYTGRSIRTTAGVITTEEEAGDGSSPAPSRTPPRTQASADDSFESRQKRRWAASILNSGELLQLHALARDDSVPGTHQHFTKILCGYEDSGRSGGARGGGSSAGGATGKKEKEKERERDKERERKPISKVHYKPITGAFEL